MELPDSPVAAELSYEFGGQSWSARVYRGAYGEGIAYLLFITLGKRTAFAGPFQTGKALVKYVREKAKEKFSAYEPVVDTLDRIRDKAPTSLTPDCYVSLPEGLGGSGCGMPECPSCPYRSVCGVCTSPAAPVPAEMSEETFLAELQKKMAKYGGEQ